MQRDKNLPIQFVVSESIVGARGVAVAEGVVPHILGAEPTWFQDRTRGALEFHPLPTSVEKAFNVTDRPAALRGADVRDRPIRHHRRGARASVQ